MAEPLRDVSVIFDELWHAGTCLTTLQQLQAQALWHVLNAHALMPHKRWSPSRARSRAEAVKSLTSCEGAADTALSEPIAVTCAAKSAVAARPPP